MLKAQQSNLVRFVLVSLLVVMLAISVVGAVVTTQMATGNGTVFDLFQAQSLDAGPSAVIAGDCDGGSQSGCGGG